jgi:hypothetical protein
LAGKRQNSDATLGNAGTGAGYWSATELRQPRLQQHLQTATARKRLQFVASNTNNYTFFFFFLPLEVYIDVLILAF